MRKNNRWCRLAVGSGMLFSVALFSGQAQIPTKAERVLNSGLNPSNITWKAKNMRLWPMPTPASNAPLVACYRYDFELSAQPRQAALTVMPSVPYRYWVAVNGAVLAEPLPGKMGAIRNLDLTRALKPGHNVITVRGEGAIAGHGLHLRAEGIVFGEDGRTVRLLTGQDWRGGWNLAEGWDRPGTDPTNLPPVEVFDRLPARAGLIPPYYGPIQVAPAGMNQPLFDEEKPIELDVTVMNAVSIGTMVGGQLSVVSSSKPESQPPTAVKRLPDTAIGSKAGELETLLNCEIFDETSRKVVETKKVALAPEGQLDLRGVLKAGPLPQGVYRFRFVLTAGTNEVDRRDYEVVSVGVIQQRLVEGTSYEDGLDLKKVWSVDCAAEPKAGEYIAIDPKGNPYKTKVVNSPLGDYRAMVEIGYMQSFGYRFKVDTLYVPHLVVIEWPDDAQRGILAQVYELGGMIPEDSAWKTAGVQKSEASIVCTPDHPRVSGKMQKLHLIYWPNEAEASIHIMTASGGAAPAAAARITVYEIANDLPALRITDAGDHLIGYHTERGPQTMAASYYAGPLGAAFEYGLNYVDHPEFYQHWYVTAANYIKRARFSGQNLYLMGHFMYDGVEYPSKRYIAAANHYRGGDANRDYLGLILRMFERNGLSMVSGIEYVNTPDIKAASTSTLEQVINTGAPTLYSINKDAALSTMHGIQGWSGLNYFHPQVQDSVFSLVDELVALYKDYPAWKGIGFILSRNFGPMMTSKPYKDDPLYYGYEDYTIDLFQKETGIKIPVDPRDPARFGKRYDWLMANAKQPWIDWRCAQFTKMFCRFRDRLVQARPDLKLYLLNAEPMNGTSEADSLTGHFDDAAALKNAVKKFGFDPDALKKENGMVINYFYPSPGTGCTVGAPSRVWRELTYNQLWHDLFANDAKGGAYIWSGIPHYAVSFPKGKWLFDQVYIRQGFFWPRYLADEFVNVWLRSSPTWMPHTWMDVAESGGRLHDLRLFARAYRSLPNGRYTRLAGDGLDLNLWVATAAVKGAEYGYAANPEWWDLDEVTLAFADGVKVHDLIKDQPVRLKKGRWTFKLGPYDLQAFRIEGGPAGGSGVRGAAVVTPPDPKTAVELKVSAAQTVARRARAREPDLKNLPGWKYVGALEQLIAGIQPLVAAGDWARAQTLADSWSLEWTQARVVNEVLEAMPFLVLGPFGDPKFTEAPPAAYYEVAKDYRGMETPYLGEFAEADSSKLIKGFVPDIAKTWTAYPDRLAHWQPVVKTDYVSFYGTCHSEYPSWMVAYGYTEIFSPVSREAVLWTGSDHAVWVWINDERVLQYGGAGTSRGGQRPSAPDQNRAPVRLAEGWNRVLVKALQRGETRIFFRLTDANGQGLDDLKFRVPPAAAG